MKKFVYKYPSIAIILFELLAIAAGVLIWFFFHKTINKALYLDDVLSFTFFRLAASFLTYVLTKRIVKQAYNTIVVIVHVMIIRLKHNI
jgi:ABC-type uncharacterized transport system permease subunit